jgi:hypothetical protein
MKRFREGQGEGRGAKRTRTDGDLVLRLRPPPTRRPTSAWGHLTAQVPVYDMFNPGVTFMHLGHAAGVLGMPYHAVHKAIKRGHVVAGRHLLTYRYFVF